MIESVRLFLCVSISNSLWRIELYVQVHTMWVLGQNVSPIKREFQDLIPHLHYSEFSFLFQLTNGGNGR